MTKRIYKSSTQALGYSKPSPSSSGSRDDAQPAEGEGASWEDEGGVREGSSLYRLSDWFLGLLLITHNTHLVPSIEDIANQNQLDRMTMWIKDVESK